MAPVMGRQLYTGGGSYRLLGYGKVYGANASPRTHPNGIVGYNR